MNEVICPTCKKEITVEMEVEYSAYLTEFFCSPDCAIQEYMEQMQSSPFEMTEENVRTKNLAIENGKLYRVWREQYENMKKKGR
ncbi:hypothetical protein [Paenibacillus sp. ISL-20]|uniref:hypothetical protein n=1 Tax=Paenibacillus sp. ISL-20 TaxID=2819163 RepID=UPI001BE8D155|nr:hypothetical protein [Paenibacillus sp. ISL-20]MBT2759991.1 hypothetical protein [Paenibacillus sp. ISL-20]